MNSQKGMATLLVTSMLLVVSLLFSLASYKNVFYQIKRTQNEVLARQAHWLAEGGLECGYSVVKKNNDKNADLSSCLTISDYNLDSLSVVSSGTSSLMVAKAGFKSISKAIAGGGGGSHGVIKSSADLYFKGDHEYYSDSNVKLSDGTWACLILRYKTKFYINDDSTSFFTNLGTKTAGSCNANYVTNTKHAPTFKKDIQVESNLDVFKETFQVSRNDWIDVRDGGVFRKFNIIDPNKCASEIAAKIDNEHRYIWATGNCFLEHAGLADLSAKSQAVNGVFLLVENGVLSVNGTSSTYKGIIYHFSTNFNPIQGSVNVWSESTSGMNTYIQNLTMYKPSGLTLTEDKKKAMRDSLVFFMNGSFVPTGGFILDTPNKLSYFNMASVLTYDGTLINDLLSPFSTPKWVEGSWHDF
jgi:hypothetical protein